MPCALGNQYIFSSTLDLTHKLIDALQKESSAPPTAPAASGSVTTLQSRLVWGGVSDYLGGIKKQLITQNMLEQGNNPEGAAKEISLFLNLIDQLGKVETSTAHRTQPLRIQRPHWPVAELRRCGKSTAPAAGALPLTRGQRVSGKALAAGGSPLRFHTTPGARTPMSIDPNWAWQPYRPDAKNPWDLAKAGHLYRRAGFSANSGELDAALADGPDKAVGKLLGGVAGQDAFEQQMSDMAASLDYNNEAELAPGGCSAFCKRPIRCKSGSRFSGTTISPPAMRKSAICVTCSAKTSCSAATRWAASARCWPKSPKTRP